MDVNSSDFVDWLWLKVRLPRSLMNRIKILGVSNLFDLLKLCLPTDGGETHIMLANAYNLVSDGLEYRSILFSW
jgi:hypothetical protein